MAKEKTAKTDEQKAAEALQRRELNIATLLQAFSVPDETLRLNLFKVLNVKLTVKEIDAFAITDEQKEFLKTFGEGKFITTKAFSAGGTGSKKMYIGTPVEAEGKAVMASYLQWRKSVETELGLLEEAGFILQPLWRNKNAAGVKGGKGGGVYAKAETEEAENKTETI